MRFCSGAGSEIGRAAERGRADGFGLADSTLVGTGLVDGLTGACVGIGLADSALVDGLAGGSA